MTIGDTTENAILNLIYSATAWANYADNAAGTPQTNIHCALHTADPTDSGTMSSSESAYTNYVRVNVARSTGWSTASAGSISPAANIDFASSGAAGTTVTHWSTGKTGGGTTAILWSGGISPTIAIGASGVIPRLTTASTITLDEMKYNDEFARCLAEIDVPGIRRLWKFVSPHLPQPTSDREALLAIHHARTQTRSFSLRLRAYSHGWLLDNGYPSGLPDELKPKAERMYPRIQEGVGISCRGSPAAPIVQSAMLDAVDDIYVDDNHPDPVKVKKRIMEVRQRTRRKLFG